MWRVLPNIRSFIVFCTTFALFLWGFILDLLPKVVIRSILGFDSDFQCFLFFVIYFLPNFLNLLFLLCIFLFRILIEHINLSQSRNFTLIFHTFSKFSSFHSNYLDIVSQQSQFYHIVAYTFLPKLLFKTNFILKKSWILWN